MDTDARADGPVLLVTNSLAGSADDDTVEDVCDVLRTNHAIIRETCDGPDDLRHVVDAFRGDRVITAGGDGSLHALINVLADLDRLATTAVGLVPLGTGNDFARGVGLPTDPAEAARVCARGTPAPIDAVVADDGEVTVNAAHAGMGALASERAQVAKPAVGPLAYPLAALASGITTTGYDLTVRVDGTTVHEGRTLFVLAANGPSIGGGAALAPTADPTDGVVDVLVIGEVAVTDRPGLALRIQRGDHMEHDDVRSYRGETLHIAGDPVDHSRDGEIRRGLREVTYTIRPSAWRLLTDGDMRSQPT